MDDLLSIKGKELIIYEKSDLKKYIIKFLLEEKFGNNIENNNIKNNNINTKVNLIFKNINNDNFGDYFNIERIKNKYETDFSRSLVITYKGISIITGPTEKKDIIEFKKILNENEKINKKILDLINTFIDFFLEYDQNIDRYMENIKKKEVVMLSTIFLQYMYSNISIKFTLLTQFINENFESIITNYTSIQNNNIKSYNYIIEEEKIILKINISLWFMKNNNEENKIFIPFKVIAEFNIKNNEITVKSKGIINKNNLDMLYMFNSIYFYMEINEKYKDDQFKVEMLEYLKKICNDNKSFKLIYNLLKNIKTESDIKIILNIIKNKLDNKFINKIPIKKDETKKNYQKDFLLINFNEEKRSFDENDCMSMLIKILLEEPSFIIVSTQDCKTSGKGHYQHILGEKLKVNGYNLLVKNTIDTIRMRIYYNTKKVKFNKSEQKYKYTIMKGGDLIPSRIKQIFKKSNNLKENFSNSSNNSKNKNFNKNLFLIKNYGRKESIDKKYGHGLVFMRLEIIRNDSFTKFIFINCDLSLNRESELENIVNDFKLVDYWRKGYNIFFCGNFNIEAFPFPIESKNIIKEYSTNISINKKKSSKQFITMDKLAIFLKNKMQTSISNNNIIFQLLLDSIEKLGIHPTYKYIKDKSKKQVDFYNDIIDYTNKLKNINDPNRYIIKFLNIPNLLEKIKDSKNLIYEYFKILIELNLLTYSYRIVNGRRSYNKKITEEIINYILIMKNKNFINKKTFNEIIKKYNINDKNIYINSMINFSEELNKQRKPSEQKKIIDDYLKQFINNKDSFNKIKKKIENIIEKKVVVKLDKIKKKNENIIEKKVVVKLDYECEKFIKKLITNKLLKEDENNNIFIEKKRDDLLEKYNEIFNTESNKIIPYQPNRILYAISDDIPVCNSNVKKCYYNPIIPDSFDFDIYLFPDKSSHKLTTLSFKIYEEGNIISKNNNRNLIPEVQKNNYKNNLEKIVNPIIGKNISSNTHVIPTEIVSNIIKKIEKKKTKTISK